MMQRRFAQKPKFEGKHADLSEKIIAIFYQVQAELGFGFSEKVYQKALAIALRHSGLKVDEQVPLKVYYRGEVVGEFFADMLINDLILLELKSASAIIPEYEAQLLNYLKATRLERGLLLNFGRSSLEVKRLIFQNLRKSGASVKLSLSCDLKGGHHGMTRLPCSPTGMPPGN